MPPNRSREFVARVSSRTLLAGKTQHVAFGPRAHVEDVLSSRALKVHCYRFVDGDSVAATAERFVKVVAVLEKRFDSSFVSAHAEDHRHCFVDRQVIKPAIADTKRSERSHRQRDVVWKFLSQVMQQRAIELSLRNRYVKVDLNCGNVAEIQRSP